MRCTSPFCTQNAEYNSATTPSEGTALVEAAKAQTPAVTQVRTVLSNVWAGATEVTLGGHRAKLPFQFADSLRTPGNV